MAYITKADLASHLYVENLDEITRGRDDLVTRAIKAGISEAQSYLSRYELSVLMGDPPQPEDENLKMKVQDLIVWHLIKLGCANIDFEATRIAYKYSIDWFDKIMRGLMSPAGWPYHDTTTDPAPPSGNEIAWSSNTKRTNHF